MAFDLCSGHNLSRINVITIDTVAIDAGIFIFKFPYITSL